MKTAGVELPPGDRPWSRQTVPITLFFSILPAPESYAINIWSRFFSSNQAKKLVFGRSIELKKSRTDKKYFANAPSLKIDQ